MPVYSAASTSTSKYILTSIYKCVPPTNEGAPSSFLARNAPTCGTADSPTCRLGSWGAFALLCKDLSVIPKRGACACCPRESIASCMPSKKKKNSLLYRLRSTARNPWALLQLLGLADMGPAKPPPLFLHAPLIERFQKASRTLPV